MRTDPVKRGLAHEAKEILGGKKADFKYGGDLYARAEDVPGLIQFEGGASRRVSDAYWQKPHLNWPVDSATPIGPNPQSGRIPPGIFIGPGADPVNGVQLITPWIGN